MLELRSLPIPDVKVIRPDQFSDDHGYRETFQRSAFAEKEILHDFAQDNQSSSDRIGTRLAFPATAFRPTIVHGGSMLAAVSMTAER